MSNALHFWLNTTLPASKYLKCFPSFISVEGHTDWITVTVLMCELQVSVTSCSGHNDLNENQTTPLLPEDKCWGHSDLMWLPSEPPPLRNHFTLGLTLVIFHPSGWAQSTTTSTPILHPIPGHVCSLQEGQVPDLYHSCKYQSPFHNHLYLSQQVCTFITLSGSELHTNKKSSSYSETSVLRCWGSLVMIMYKLTTNQPWWY